MGFAIMLKEIAKTLLFFGIPVLTTILTLTSLNKTKHIGLSTDRVLKTIGLSLIKSIVIIVVTTIAILLFLIFTVDLSDS